MILPSVVRSGVMPKCSCAQPLAMRKPVMTSSKHSRAPSSRVMSWRPCTGQHDVLGLQARQNDMQQLATVRRSSTCHENVHAAAIRNLASTSCRVLREVC